MKKQTLVACGAVAMILGLAAPWAMAGGPDEQWSVTAKATLTAPMHMSMPAMTTTQCNPAGGHQGPPAMKNSDCKVKHWDRSGDRISYEVSCDQNGTIMTGKGWTEITGGSMKGHMSLSGSAGGTAMAMAVEYSGKRTGTCTAAKSAE